MKKLEELKQNSKAKHAKDSIKRHVITMIAYVASPIYLIKKAC